MKRKKKPGRKTVQKRMMHEKMRIVDDEKGVPEIGASFFVTFTPQMRYIIIKVPDGGRRHEAIDF